MDAAKTNLKSIVSPITFLSQKGNGSRLKASCIVVGVSALLSSFAPLCDLAQKGLAEPYNLISAIVLFAVSILTYFAACALFYLISFLFKKGVGFKEIVSTWGMSYLPNLICIIAYYTLLMKFPLMQFDGVFAFVVNTFFIMLLVYKALYFFMEMKVVLKVTAFELLISTIGLGIAFVLLMWIGFAVGIQVPML